MSAVLLFLLLVLLPAGALAEDSTGTTEPGVSAAAGELVPAAPAAVSLRREYHVGAGDVLRWSVFGEDELAGLVTVSPAGDISLPLLGNVHVEGLTPEQIAELLEERFGADYLVDPHVSVTVETYGSKPVQVLGAVKSPGQFHLTGPTTLLEMLALAGGVVSEKSIKEVHVQRARDPEGEPLVVDLERLLTTGEGNVLLEAGDVVYVPEGLVVYLAGEVQKPGSVPYFDGLTVMQALTAAGGPKPTAKLREAYILRDGERMKINLKRIIQGRDEDVRLQPGDQVYLEESVF